MASATTPNSQAAPGGATSMAPSGSSQNQSQSLSSPQNLWEEALKLLRPDDADTVRLKQTDKLAVLTEALAAANEKKKLCEEKQWKYKRSDGTVIVFRDIFDKIVSWLKKLEDVGNLVAQVDPVHAAIPWAAINFFLQIVMTDSEKLGVIYDGIETVTNMMGRYAIFEELYLQEQTKATDILKLAIIKLYASILTFLAEAKGHYAQNTGIRIVKTTLHISQRDMSKLIEDIQDEQLTVDEIARLIDAEYLRATSHDIKAVSLNTDQHAENMRKALSTLETPLQNVRDQLEGIAKELDRTKKLEVLSWLSKMPYSQHHESVRQGRLENSGLWLFGEPNYVMWRKSRSSSLLWLHGIPGSGKSKLVSLIVDTVKENQINVQAEPLAYVYCTRSNAEPERANPDHILRSILRQLSCARPSLPIKDPVFSKYQEVQADDFGMRELTLGDSKSLILELLSNTTTTIIIDALDECNPKRRFELLGAIEQFMQHSGSVVKILVSSRDPGIPTRLDKPSSLRIDAATNTHDIERFVETEVGQSIRNERLLGGNVSPGLQAKIIKTLTDGAQGMFLWVSLQLQNLCDPDRFKLEEDVIEELGRLPQELAEIYNQIYNKIAGNRAGQNARRIAETALQWLLCAQKSLSTVDFMTAVCFSATGHGAQVSTATFVDLCGNFLVADKELDIFRFFHLSVREFLQARPDFTPNLTHATAAEICINTLLTREWLSSETTWQKASLYQYVTLYWAPHVEECSQGVLTDKIRNGLAQLSTPDGLVPPWFAKWLLQVDSASQALGWDDPLKDKIEESLSDAPATSFFTGCVFGLTDIVRALTDSTPNMAKRTNAKGATGLHLASQYGHLDVVKLLVLRGAEPNQKDENEETPLVRASLSGHEHIVRLLLQNGADPKLQGRKYGSALQAACLHGQESVVEILLEVANVDVEGGQFGTSLQAASLRGHARVVEMLLDKGAEVNAPGGQYATTPQLTPSKIASSGISRVFQYLLRKSLLLHGPDMSPASPTSHYEAIVQLLLDRKLDFSIDPAGFGTALQAASRAGHEHVVKILINRGADVNVEGGAYGTALQAASVCGSDAAVQLLLDAGADVNAQKGVYDTAIQAACRRSHIHIVEELLHRGANINAQGGVYRTALQAAVRSQNVALVRLLLDRGADVNAWGGQYGTALQAGSIDGSQEIVQLLLDYGAKTDIEGGKYGSALQAAAATGNVGVVELLVRNGAKMGTALQMASMGGYSDIVCLLLDRGADPNHQRDYFGTALQMATAGGREEIVKLLLDWQADANSESSYFGTAIQIAAAAGNVELVRLLLANGADPSALGEDHGIVTAQMLQSEEDEGEGWTRSTSALQLASAAGNDALVRMLLDAYSKLTLDSYNVESQFFYALQEASANGHSSIVRLLLDHGAEVNNDRFRYNKSPLVAASENGHEAVVHILLAKGADINTKKYAALVLAAENGHESIVRLLLHGGAEISRKSDDTGTALHAAAFRGHQSLVRLFLDKGADCNSQQESNCSPIFLATYNGHVEIVRMLILAHADINAETTGYLSSAYAECRDFDTPLQTAAFKGYEDIVRMLLENGANIDRCEGLHGTALLAASSQGHWNIANILLGSGADVDIVNEGRERFGTALQAAAYGGFENIVEMLVERHADVNAEGGKYGTAIQAAASCGHESIVRLLIEHGADLHRQGGKPEKEKTRRWYEEEEPPVKQPSARHQNGMYGTALQAAATNGNVEIVRMLVQNGADIGDEDEHGQTPLHRAAYGGHEAVVALLLDHGADINIKDRLGRTALRWAASFGYRPLFGFLSKSGASIDAQDAQGQTALHRAAFNGQVHMVQALLEKGSNLEGVDKMGCTPLFTAAENGQLPVVRYLLGKGARIEHRDVLGRNVLHCAAVSGQHTLIPPLLAAGADIHATTTRAKSDRDNDLTLRSAKQTPLHLAAMGNLSEIPYLLLINGAEIDAQDSQGFTPLHIAAYHDNYIAATLLLDRGANLWALDERGSTPRQRGLGNTKTGYITSTLLREREKSVGGVETPEIRSRQDSPGEPISYCPEPPASWTLSDILGGAASDDGDDDSDDSDDASYHSLPPSPSSH